MTSDEQNENVLINSLPEAINFWKQISRLYPASGRIAQTVDGVTGEQDIANMWKEHFSETLNSVHSEVNKDYVENFLSQRPENDEQFVSVDELSIVVKKLQTGKSVGRDGVPAEVYKYATRRLLYLLSVFFTGCLKCSYLPDELMCVTMQPIVKNKRKSHSDKGNYRPIAIATASSKLLELLLLNRMSPYLETADNQFGFKPRLGTEMAVFSLKETIHYYRSRGSPVYLCFLDARKAFDRVNHWTLFKKLIDRGVPNSVIKTLVFWYRTQEMIVGWGGCVSSGFKTTNGIKQGGLLSPSLFNVFVDGINDSLAASEVGCSMGGVSVNTISYADDMVLIAPHANALQQLVNICEQEAQKLDILYNTEKSVCMLVKPNRSRIEYRREITLNNVPLEFVESFPYLGHLITQDAKDNADIIRQRQRLNATGNELIRKFTFCSSEVKDQLFKTYCYPVYCNSLWGNFTMQCVSQLRVTYNDIFRRLHRAPRWTRASFIFAIHHVNDLKVVARKSAYSLKQRVSDSDNIVVMAVWRAGAGMKSPILERWDRILLVQHEPVYNRNVI